VEGVSAAIVNNKIVQNKKDILTTTSADNRLLAKFNDEVNVCTMVHDIVVERYLLADKWWPPT
jgi:hypothetical protein